MAGSKGRKGLSVALAVLVAVLVLAAGCGGGGEAGGTGVREAAAFDPADYAGRPLVVNFFGSWCPPCNVEAPELAAFVAAHPEAGFAAVAVNDTAQDAAAFASKYGLACDLYLDDGRLASQYGITGVPTTIFFDAAGHERDRVVGAADGERFAAGLAAAQ